jgi:putative peptide zinc metalloprotease protein
LELPEDPFLPQTNRFMFGLYTVAAVAYRWFIFCSILFFLNAVFEPYGLQIIGRGLALMGLFGLVVQPLWQGGKFMHIPGRMDQVKWPRVFGTVAVVATVFFLIMMIPIPRNVRCTLQVEPMGAAVVYADEAGTIDQLHVHPGDKVSAGDPLATLENPMLVSIVAEHEREKDSYQARLEGLTDRLLTDPNVASRIAGIKAAIRGKERELKEQQLKLERLTLRAPKDGVVLAPPLRPRQPTIDGELVAWSGSIFDDVNEGAFLQPTEVVCQIGDPARLEAVLAIDQADVDFIQVGQEVKMLFDALTDTPIIGTIAELSRREMQRTPPGMGNQAGGGLATRMDPAGNEVPLSATYQAKVPIENADQLVFAGYRGRAKIRAGKQTLGNRIWRYLARTFHFEI